MTKIKIKSNPYNREISYLIWDEAKEKWENVRQTDERSRLRETDSERSFLPFKIKEIVNIIIKEYYVGREKIELYFEGTQDEYAEVVTICEADDLKDKIICKRTDTFLENARFIKGDIKEIFERVYPVINDIMKDNPDVIRGLKKVTRALDDVIPICVFGNYSAGKSTFINALIGEEILPSGGDPVTAKIYEISNSKFPDRARISFEFHEEKVELSIEGKKFRVLKGNSELDIVKSIKEKIDTDGTNNLYAMVRIALNVINFYENRDKEVAEISNVITLSVPFADEGVISNSNNRFVIFDTPGSNSNSNKDHSKVLAEAMKDFSNGVPIWVTQYDAHDTTDNADLCDKVLAIESLDKRFTMIIFNKSDDADLPEDGFDDNQTKDILEYRAIEKMYANGIFFVSSIMGLGAKNEGEFVDRFYKKTFRTQSFTFSDPEDPYYMPLYKYNIMPEQVKKNVVDYSEKNNNLIYSNSGLYCVEKEIENFGSKHSAYNKCQMVLGFLNNVVDKTNKRIEDRKAALESAREKSKQELDEKSAKIEEELENSSEYLLNVYERASQDDVQEFVQDELKYQLDVEKLEDLDAIRREENLKVNNFESRENDYKEAKDKFFEHIKESSQGLLKNKAKGSLKTLKSLKDDLTSDYKNIQNKKDKMQTTEKESDKRSTEEILKHVINSYNDYLNDAQDKLADYLDKYWKEKEYDFKKGMILEITNSDTLSDIQRDELADMIQNYTYIDFNDDAQEAFARKKFLKGQLLGIRFREDEKLNIKRLAKSYNAKINKVVDSLSKDMNAHCFEKFSDWKEKLLTEIFANLTEYNSELRQLAELIRFETEELQELASHQRTIKSSLEAIISLMDWKEAEGE